jgi:hypothetical protein
LVCGTTPSWNCYPLILLACWDYPIPHFTTNFMLMGNVVAPFIKRNKSTGRCLVKQYTISLGYTIYREICYSKCWPSWLCRQDKTFLVFATPVFPLDLFLPLTLLSVSVMATYCQSFPKKNGSPGECIHDTLQPNSGASQIQSEPHITI